MEISVVICTCSRSEDLKEALDSLLNQKSTEGFDYEAIVVDNNSKDNTKEVVKTYKAKFNRKLRYVIEARQGLSYARNRGIKEARGAIIAFIDDDCIVDRNWLLNIWYIFNNYKCDAMGGRVLPLYHAKTPQWIKKNNVLLNGPIPMHDYGEEIKHYTKNMLPFIGGNIAFRKNCFDKYGLFNTELGIGTGRVGEETDFFRRLEGKQEIIYAGQALVWHKVTNKRTNLRHIAKWFIASGRYKALIEPQNPKNTVCYLGIPRYLFMDITEHIFILIQKILTRKDFLKTWIAIFAELGKILGYSRRKCIP